MSDQTDFDGIDDQGGDSSVLKALRQQLKQAEGKAKLYDQAREQAAEAVLTSAGFPGLKSVFIREVQDFPTPEKVAEFLEGLGLKAQAETQPPATEAEPVKTETATKLADVSSLGAQVASAATKQGTDPQADLAAAIAGTKNREEVASLMQAAGLRM